MLPGGSDSVYRKALARPHKHRARVEVWDGTGTTKLATLDSTNTTYGKPMGYLAGSTVSATLSNRTSRAMNLQVPSYLYPVKDTDLLAPFGNELRAWRGIEFGNGDFYEWQVFRGRIRTATEYSTGTCSVTASDRGTDIADAAFIQPENSHAGSTVSQEFVRLISDGVVNPTFGVSDQINVPVQALTWEFDRAAALEEMATSASAMWYALANGDFVLRKYPWIGNGEPVVTLADTAERAENPIINWWQRSRSRAGIFNAVAVSGERLDGSAPVHKVAIDNDPNSVTNPATFGRKARLDVLQTPATPAQAADAAKNLLKTLMASVETWQLGIVPDASLELGDVVKVMVESGTSIQVITGIAVPLHLGEYHMTLQTRSLVPAGLGV